MLSVVWYSHICDRYKRDQTVLPARIESAHYKECASWVDASLSDVDKRKCERAKKIFQSADCPTPVFKLQCERFTHISAGFQSMRRSHTVVPIELAKLKSLWLSLMTCVTNQLWGITFSQSVQEKVCTQECVPWWHWTTCWMAEYLHCSWKNQNISEQTPARLPWSCSWSKSRSAANVQQFNQPSNSC